MIIRLSAKLSKKLKLPLSETLPEDPDQLADWSAHLFIANRSQYIIVTNTATLYSVVFEGKGITNESKFLDALTDHLSNYLRFDGHLSVYAERIEPLMSNIWFSKACNRSVIGSVTELVYAARIYIEDNNPSLLGVSHMLNRVLMSYLSYSRPEEVFRSVVENHRAPGPKGPG